MKIAVTSTGDNLGARVDPRFGRCGWFVVVDTDDMSWEAVQNPNASAGGGAGVQSGQLMVEREVKAVLTGNCGPNAFQVLAAGGIEVIVGVSGTVREAVEAFKAGNLRGVSEANVADHFGMGGGMGTGRGMGRAAAPPTPAGNAAEVERLKAQAAELATQLKSIQERIDRLSKGE